MRPGARAAVWSAGLAVALAAVAVASATVGPISLGLVAVATDISPAARSGMLVGRALSKNLR